MLSVTDRLKALLDEREKLGLSKYGKLVTPGDGHDWRDEALEELLDALQYMMAYIFELEEVGEE